MSTADHFPPQVPADRTSLTDDERIGNIVPLPPPEHLIRFFPIQGTPVEKLVADTRKRIKQILHGAVRPPARDHRAVLDPRPGGRGRLRDAARAGARAARRRPRDRDAGLLREAAHHRRLEGADQRPLPERQLPHQRGPARRARPPRAHQPGRRPGGLRVPRRDLAAVHRRPDQLGRDRRAHHREPGAPRARLRPLRPGRLQERHRRQRPDRRRRDPRRPAAAPFPVGAQERPGRDRRDARQPGLPHHPPRRARAELRRGERGDRVQGARGGRRERAPDDRLLAREQPQGLPPADRGRRRRRRPARRGRAPDRRRDDRVAPQRRDGRTSRPGSRSRTARASPTPASASTTRCRCSTRLADSVRRRRGAKRPATRKREAAERQR